MQQALQYGQNDDFILVWPVGHFVAFRVGMGPWDALVTVRETINQAIEHEQTLTLDDALFLALQQLKNDANRDIPTRMAQVEKKTVDRTPETVLLALVMVANWYDNAARKTDITSRNTVNHPDFVPVQPLRVHAR